MKTPGLTKRLAMIVLFVLIVLLTFWAYLQPTFLMDLANKYVFC